MAKEVESRVRYCVLRIFSVLLAFSTKVFHFLSLSWSGVIVFLRILEKKLRASCDHYTVLIVPQKKNNVKKISASSVHIGWAIFAVAVLSFSGIYFFYYFLSIERDSSELEQLRRMSISQKEQIHRLASKVGDFEKRMEVLREYDLKIRAMANIVGKPKEQLLGVGGPSPEPSAYRPPTSSQSASVNGVSMDMDQLIQQATKQEHSFKEILEFLEKRKSILSRTPSLWPVQGWVTSHFGYRLSPFTGKREFHGAIDIACRSGMEIIAPADGIVADVERRSDLGNAVTIDHGNGIHTAYGHLLKAAVHKGKTVKRGEVIGFVGSTGRSTGSHLHYCVYLNGVPVNPRKYLP